MRSVFRRFLASGEITGVCITSDLHISIRVEKVMRLTVADNLVNVDIHPAVIRPGRGH